MFLEKITNSRSNIFLAAVANFIFGIAFASLLKVKREGLFWLIWFLILSFIGLIIIKTKKWRVFILLVFFLLIGVLRFAFAEPVNKPDNLRFYSGRFGIIDGFAVSDGEISGNYQRIYLKAGGIKFFEKDEYKKINGKTLIYLDKYPLYALGDNLEVRCSLVDPETLEKDSQFSYTDYLHKEGVWIACFNAKVIERRSGGFNFYKFFLNLKKIFNEKINFLLPEPHSSFLRGLLYGDRGSIPNDLQNAFSKTGVTHIIAISGYNITVIVAALLILCKTFKISRQRAFWLIAGIIIFFILLTGASASVCRAGVMGFLVLWGKRLGRSISAGRLLTTSAAILLAFNPYLLIFDAGFQLSFLSTIGLIYFAPILEKYTERFPNFFSLKEIFLTTLAAIIFTLPLIIYTFGRFSLIAPFVNLLILPAVPLAMFFGFVMLLSGIIYLPLGHLLAYITWAILSYIIKTVEFLASWKFSAINLFLPWWVMILFYLLLIYFFYVNFKKNKI